MTIQNDINTYFFHHHAGTILESIMNVKTGTQTPADFDVSQVEQSSLPAILEQLISNWSPAIIASLYDKFCSPANENNRQWENDKKGSSRKSQYTVDKCVFEAVDLFNCMCGASTTGRFFEEKFVNTDKSNGDKEHSDNVAQASVLQNLNEPTSGNLTRVDNETARQRVQKCTNLKKRKIDTFDSSEGFCSKKMRLEKEVQLAISTSVATGNISTDNLLPLIEKRLIVQEVLFALSVDDRKIKEISEELGSPVIEENSFNHQNTDSCHISNAHSSTIMPNKANYEMQPPTEFHHVLAFIHMCIDKFIPFQIFGSNCNKRHFQNFVKSVLMAGVEDTITVRSIMHKFKPTQCR